MKNINQNNYYVYALIDPRDESIFYIGKGRGSRAKSHSKETRKNISNINKYLRIKEIQNSGLKVIAKALFTDLTESNAFELEKIIIYKLGREGFDEGQLTNFIPGGVWQKGDSLFYDSSIQTTFDTTYLDFFAAQRFNDIKKTSDIIHISDLSYENVFKYHHSGTLASIDSKTCFFKNEHYILGLSFLNSDLPIINTEYVISNVYIKDIYISKFIPIYLTHLFDSEFYKALDKQIESNIKEFDLISNKSKNLIASFKDNRLILTSNFVSYECVNHFHKKNDGSFSHLKNETSLHELNLSRINESKVWKKTELIQKDIDEYKKVNETWANIQDDYWNDFIKSKF